MRIINADDVAIYGYTGKESNLVLPAEIGGYTVTKIDGGAFKNSRISTVTVTFEVTIAPDAFVNCKNLRGFLATEKVTIYEGAFSGCNAELESNFYYPVGSHIFDNFIK